MAKTIVFTNRFKKELEQAIKRGKNPDKLKAALKLLSENTALPISLRDHKLKGNYVGWRELHIEPNLLLIYQATADEILCDRIGTHSDLFDE